MADQNNSCQQPQGPQQPYQNQQYQNQQYSQQQNSSGSFDWFVNTPDYTQQFHPQDISDGKAMSILAYFDTAAAGPAAVGSCCSGHISASSFSCRWSSARSPGLAVSMPIRV